MRRYIAGRVNGRGDPDPYITLTKAEEAELMDRRRNANKELLALGLSSVADKKVLNAIGGDKIELSARMTELALRQQEGPLSVSDQAELADLRAKYNRVHAIRAAISKIETAIQASDAPETFDLENHPLWP